MAKKKTKGVFKNDFLIINIIIKFKFNFKNIIQKVLDLCRSPKNIIKELFLAEVVNLTRCLLSSRCKDRNLKSLDKISNRQPIPPLKI